MEMFFVCLSFHAKNHFNCTNFDWAAVNECTKKSPTVTINISRNGKKKLDLTFSCSARLLSVYIRSIALNNSSLVVEEIIKISKKPPRERKKATTKNTKRRKKQRASETNIWRVLRSFTR